MGSILNRMGEHRQSNTSRLDQHLTPVKDFEFLEPFSDGQDVGRCCNGIYLPEELWITILSYVDPKELLGMSLVCKHWCNLVKNALVWRKIFKRRSEVKQAPKLPWFVFYNFFTTDNYSNLIKNGNGERRYEHWSIVLNFGDEFRIENPPVGVDALPDDVPEFNGSKSCFATSFYECNKLQIIDMERKRLLRYIIKEFHPTIYVSEWIAGRFDCSCMYKCDIYGYKISPDSMKNTKMVNLGDEDDNIVFHKQTKVTMAAGEAVSWQKIEMLVDEYEPTFEAMVFEHEGQDTQFWKGHYGSKMAGAVVRFDFDSIKPI